MELSVPCEDLPSSGSTETAIMTVDVLRGGRSQDSGRQCAFPAPGTWEALSKRGAQLLFDFKEQESLLHVTYFPGGVAVAKSPPVSSIYALVKADTLGEKPSPWSVLGSERTWSRDTSHPLGHM